VLSVLARAPIAQQILAQIGQTQRRIQFPVGQQPGIRLDFGTVKFQLQVAIESHPQSLFLARTRQIPGFLVV